MNTGLIGPILGSVLGILGGVVGTYFSIRNTQGPRERTFMIRAALLCWLLLAAFGAALFLLPGTRPWLWIAYSILLPVGVTYTNKRQAALRREEQRTA